MRLFCTIALCLLAASAFGQLRGDALLDQIMREQHHAARAMEQSMVISTTGSSLRVRESGDSYLIEVSLQNRPVEDIKIERQGSRLVLSAPALPGQPAYRQEIDVSGALPEAPPRITREDGKLTIQLARDPSAPPTAATGFSDRNGDTMTRLNQIQQQANALFRQMFQEDSPFDAAGTAQPSALQLRESGPDYLVIARVPDEIARDLDITVKDQQLLLQSQNSAGNRPGIQSARGWSESLDLPGPVDTAGMTVAKTSDGLQIRLPKK